MSVLQQLMLCWMPKSWRADLIAYSQRWFAVCPCGCVRSIWELGGIRYRAAGRPRRLMRCPKCGRRTWHSVEWHESEAPTKAAL